MLTGKLDYLPFLFEPIRAQARKYAANESLVRDGEINVLHQPWVAPLSWGLRIYEAAPTDWFEIFSSQTGKEIPCFYQRFLEHLNGAFIYSLAFFGLPPGAYGANQTRMRSTVQCHDLAQANRSGISEFQIEQDHFYFATRPYSYHENVGYFFKHGKISLFRKSGRLVKQWDDFGDMLSEEVPVVEKMMIEKIPAGISLTVN